MTLELAISEKKRRAGASDFIEHPMDLDKAQQLVRELEACGLSENANEHAKAS